MRRCAERVRERVRRSDDGVGLVEVAVAIIVLGIILVGLFPLAVDSIRLAVKNSELAQANRVVAAELDASRTTLLDTDCDTVASYPVGDYTVTRSVGTCPEPERLAYVTVSVAKTDEPAVELSSANTRMIVRPVVTP